VPVRIGALQGSKGQKEPPGCFATLESRRHVGAKGGAQADGWYPGDQVEHKSLRVLFEQLIVQLISLHIVRSLFEHFWHCSSNRQCKNLLGKMSNILVYLAKKVKFLF
jgi:hypothetical protein